MHTNQTSTHTHTYTDTHMTDQLCLFENPMITVVYTWIYFSSVCTLQRIIENPNAAMNTTQFSLKHVLHMFILSKLLKLY